jgi:hypothetical protein
MKEQIEKMYIQALIDDLPPNVFADQVLRLFDVVGRSEQLPCPHCGQLEPCAGNSPETCYHPKVC